MPRYEREQDDRDYRLQGPTHYAEDDFHGYGSHDYDPRDRIQIDVKQTGGGSWKRTALLLGGGAVAGMAVLGGIHFGIGVEQETEPVEDTEVLEIKPINWDCRAFSTAAFGRSETRVDSSVPGFWIRVRTEGEVDVLTCLAGGAEIDTSDPNNVHVTVDTANIELFSRINEEETSSERDMGQGSHFGNLGIDLAGSLGVDWPSDTQDAKFDEMEQETRKNAVNHVQESCGEEAWTTTQEAIRYAYNEQVAIQLGIVFDGPEDLERALRDEGVRVNVEFVGDEPSFDAAYDLSDEYDTDFEGAEACVASPDALSPEYRLHEETEPSEGDMPNGGNTQTPRGEV